MRWRGERQSGNVEDRRGMSGGRMALGGGLIGTIIIVVMGLISGKNPLAIIADVIGNNSQSTQIEQPRSIPENDSTAEMAKVVLASTEDVWGNVFNKAGAQYQAPKLVLFTGATNTACGQGHQAMGPFYCPADGKVYIDLSFCDELRTRFGAPGNFAVAYVIAHEVGHHIQNLMGTTQQMERLRGQVSQTQYNQYSVALELQADFYAGVWANHAHQMRNILEPGDLEAALRAANAIGDDKLQAEAQGYVVPDGFTHGTSQQRMYWFKKGFETGDLNQGNTFREMGLTN